MPKYFNHFPKVYYNFDDSVKKYDYVTNLTTKISFENSFKDNSAVYYEYVVVDGETPEILAHKMYGSAERHWIILTYNNIVNPLSDWPIEQRSLNTVIDKKYQAQQYANNSTSGSGLTWARNNIHSYYKLETQTNKTTNEKFVITTELDANTYANVITSSTEYVLDSNNVVKIEITKDSQTYYEYEIENNEKKRKIKLLKPEFISAVEEEFKNIVSA